LSAPEITAGENGRIRIDGDLTFATVPGLLGKARGLFEGSSTFVVDLQGVTQADSAGLALLLEWLKRCRRREQDLYFRNLPDSLVEIAGVSSLGGLFERLSR